MVCGMYKIAQAYKQSRGWSLPNVISISRAFVFYGTRGNDIFSLVDQGNAWTSSHTSIILQMLVATDE
jgi:hypothetical protein